MQHGSLNENIRRMIVIRDFIDKDGLCSNRDKFGQELGEIT